MLVAAFESIPTDDIYASLFTVDEGRPINSNFETLGFEHHILLNNFGSLGFIVVFIILPSYPLYYIMKQFHWVRCCRKSAKRLRKYLFWGALLRILLESYVIGYICCAVMSLELGFSHVSNWTYYNSVLTVIIFPILIVFPFISAIFMLVRWNNLRK